MCRGSKFTNFPERTKLLIPTETSNLNIRLARDQVVHLEAAVNFCVSRCEANTFFFFLQFVTIIELGGITK